MASKKMVEGEFKKGDKVLLVEDVVTSGQSSWNTIQTLQKAGLVVSDIVVCIDRQKKGGQEALRSRGYNFQALATLDEVVAYDVKIQNDLHTNRAKL